MINDLVVDKETCTLSWVYDTRQVTSVIDDLDLAILDEKRELVFILSQPSPLPTLLTILNREGDLVSAFPAPEGASFYYLTSSAAKEVLVVCSFHEKREGWYDWHYALDVENKRLMKMTPSY
ncbi:hypothetical protein [Pseudescherichia vulneris]|uniref:hypothetical protein n=1 Tax=Pseudescherichia vulneris TaxID=566 RepID=UPI0028AA7A2E|nr:hypothetical protein [Pseudescherichia vulneris]